MGVFGETINTLVWVIGLLPALCFVVFTVTTLAPISPQFPSPPPPVLPLPPQLPSPPPPQLASTPVCAATPVCPASPSAHLTPDELKYKISSWGRLTVMFLCITVILLAMVRPKVEAAAKAEARAASEDDKAYKAAMEELSAARRAVDDAVKAIDTAIEQCVYYLCIRRTEAFRNAHVFSLAKDINKAIESKHDALEKARKAKPLLGLARIGKYAYLHRICFLLAICMSLATGICSGGAFFRSIELQMGASARVDTVICFAIPAILAAGLHGYYVLIAIFED